MNGNTGDGSFEAAVSFVFGFILFRIVFLPWWNQAGSHGLFRFDVAADNLLSLHISDNCPGSVQEICIRDPLFPCLKGWYPKMQVNVAIIANLQKYATLNSNLPPSHFPITFLHQDFIFYSIIRFIRSLRMSLAISGISSSRWTEHRGRFSVFVSHTAKATKPSLCPPFIFSGPAVPCTQKYLIERSG